MLTKLDETLRHQTSSTFDHAYTSDHRFFDRYWFGAYDPAGKAHLVCGLAVYLNMNVMDGFVAIQKEDAAGNILQHNFRVSRALRPDHDDSRVGPLSVDILEAFKKIRLRFDDPKQELKVDLEWEALLPPAEEGHHFNRSNGRAFQDYHRYTQVGKVNGALALHGEALAVRDWAGGRDHSWGVRSQVGGYEPATNALGDKVMAAFGYIYTWLTFTADNVGGYIQCQLLGDGTVIYTDGVIGWPATGKTAKVVKVEYQAQFHEDTRIVRHLRTTATLDNGKTLVLEMEPITGYWSMDGTGYDWGWDDGKGLGFNRGDYCEERDVFDITHPEDVVRPDGRRYKPGHREAPMRIRVTGDGAAQTGTGHQVFVVAGQSDYFGIK